MSTDEDTRLLVTVDEAAGRLGISSNHLYGLIKKGEVKSVKLGKSRRVLMSELKRLAGGGAVR